MLRYVFSFEIYFLVWFNDVVTCFDNECNFQTKCYDAVGFTIQYTILSTDWFLDPCGDRQNRTVLTNRHSETLKWWIDNDNWNDTINMLCSPLSPTIHTDLNGLYENCGEPHFSLSIWKGKSGIWENVKRILVHGVLLMKNELWLG